MILRRILDYLAQHGSAGSGQIARAVDADPRAVEAMLETLERHRRVRRWHGAACGSCQQRCGNETTVYFSLAQASSITVDFRDKPLAGLGSSD